MLREAFPPIGSYPTFKQIDSDRDKYSLLLDETVNYLIANTHPRLETFDNEYLAKNIAVNLSEKFGINPAQSTKYATRAIEAMSEKIKELGLDGTRRGNLYEHNVAPNMIK